MYLPQPESPGYGWPGQAVAGDLAELKAKNLLGTCSYMDPRTLATCKSQASQVPAGDSSELPYFTNAAIGYSAIDGAEALVGWTGTFCRPGQTPECLTNSNVQSALERGGQQHVHPCLHALPR